MALKLYEVEVRTTMVVLAEDANDAMSIAEYNAQGADLQADFPSEIAYRESLLPFGWDESCLVYQDNPEAEEVTVGECLKKLPSKDQTVFKLDKE